MCFHGSRYVQLCVHYYSFILSIKLVAFRSMSDELLYCLKTLDTFGNCRRQVFSLDVSQHMHQIKQTVKIWAQLVVEVAREQWNKKHPCHRSCLLSDAWIRAENANSIKIFWWELTSFSITTLLQREPFLTMFYIINSSPLLVTK